MKMTVTIPLRQKYLLKNGRAAMEEIASDMAVLVTDYTIGSTQKFCDFNFSEVYQRPNFNHAYKFVPHIRCSVTAWCTAEKERASALESRSCTEPLVNILPKSEEEMLALELFQKVADKFYGYVMDGLEKNGWYWLDVYFDDRCLVLRNEQIVPITTVKGFRQYLAAVAAAKTAV